jgi:DNA-binding CsgD family transcriptional regulator/PAS domain-containing protein
VHAHTVARQFDAIVSDLYRAATGAIGWAEALTPLQQAFGARTAVLQTVDLSNGAIVQLDSGGPPMQAAFLDYLRRWHVQDPRRQHLLSRLGEVVGHWWHCNDVFDEAFAQRNSFYRHFLPAHDTRYLATAMIAASPSTVSAFALELPAARGPLSADERELARRLGVHAAEALRAHDRVRRMAAQALAGHGLLSALPYPMWLLDSDRFVLHANPAASDEQAREACAALHDGRLVLRGARADRALGAALLQLAGAAHGERRVIDPRLRASEPPAWLHLQALRPAEVLAAFGERPVLLATLFDPARLVRLDAHALADSFGFTPTQARVAVLLADGLTITAIGARLGIAPTTVRTHLRAVVQRLGARRTADAVRLLRDAEVLWAQAGPG